MNIVVGLKLWAMATPWADAVEETTWIARAVSFALPEHCARSGR